MAQRIGTGIFPREVTNRFPLLPLEEEGRPNDLPLRENFVEQVFAYYRWTEMLDEEPTRAACSGSTPLTSPPLWRTAYHAESAITPLNSTLG